MCDDRIEGKHPDAAGSQPRRNHRHAQCRAPGAEPATGFELDLDTGEAREIVPRPGTVTVVGRHRWLSYWINPSPEPPSHDEQNAVHLDTSDGSERLSTRGHSVTGCREWLVWVDGRIATVLATGALRAGVDVGDDVGDDGLSCAASAGPDGRGVDCST